LPSTDEAAAYVRQVERPPSPAGRTLIGELSS
jgi:hypothetical protein